MNVRDLEAFIAVVDAGSIVTAAEKLHVTQPAVTRRIQNLERHLGAELLMRPTKPLRPSPSGLTVYEMGRRVLGSVEDLRAAFRSGAELSGEFRLGVSPYIAETAMTQPLDVLRAEFAAMKVQVVSGWSSVLAEKVRSHQLDAAGIYIANEDASGDGLTWDPIAEQSYVVVAARNSGLDGRVSLKKLRKIPWVLNQDGCGFRKLIGRTHERVGLTFEVAVEAMGSDLQLSLVSRNVGLGVLPARVFNRSHWRDKVKVIEIPELKSRMGVWLVYRSESGRLNAPIMRFRAALEAEYSRMATTRSGSASRRKRSKRHQAKRRQA